MVTEYQVHLDTATKYMDLLVGLSKHSLFTKDPWSRDGEQGMAFFPTFHADWHSANMPSSSVMV